MLVVKLILASCLFVMFPFQSGIHRIGGTNNQPTNQQIAMGCIPLSEVIHLNLIYNPVDKDFYVPGGMDDHPIPIPYITG